MRALSRAIYYVVLVAALGFWTVFTIYNAEPLALQFLGWVSMPLPIAVWILLAFVLGGIGGLLLCASGYFKGKAAQRGLELELQRRDVEEGPASVEQTPISKPVIEPRRERPMSAADSPATRSGE